jgi:hypothetical protein
MELCKFCRYITVNFQAAFPPPGEYWGSRLEHQPDLANMIRAAKSGCELCQFFLKCAERLSPDKFEKVQKEGQLYLCLLDTKWYRKLSIATFSGYLCDFDCVAPDLSRSYPLPMHMTAAKIA